MKFSSSVVSFLLVARYASAGPELSFTLKDGIYGTANSMAPSFNFEGEAGGVEFGYSSELALDDSTSVGHPYSIFGRKTTSVLSGKASIKTKVELSEGKYNFPDGGEKGIYAHIEGNNEEEDTFVWGSGVVCSNNNPGGMPCPYPLRMGAKKIITLDQGKILIAPRYIFNDDDDSDDTDSNKGTAKVVLGFEKDDTQAYLTLSKKAQNVLVKHKINEKFSASLKKGTEDFIHLSVQNESELGSSTFSYYRKSHWADDNPVIDVQLKKDGWMTQISTTCKPLFHFPTTVKFTKSITFEP